MSLPDSLFVSKDLIPREVELPDGSKHTLHFRELDSATFERFHEERGSDVAAERYGAMAALIAAAVCEPDGKPAMTVAKAATLKPKVQVMLSGIITEINGFKQKKASPSADASGSDTSSA